MRQDLPVIVFWAFWCATGFCRHVQVHLPAFPGGQMQLRRSVSLRPWSAWIAGPRPRPGCLTRQGEHSVSMLEAWIVEIIAASSFWIERVRGPLESRSCVWFYHVLSEACLFALQSVDLLYSFWCVLTTEELCNQLPQIRVLHPPLLMLCVCSPADSTMRGDDRQAKAQCNQLWTPLPNMFQMYGH